MHLEELLGTLSGSAVCIGRVVGAASDDEQVVAEAGEGTDLMMGGVKQAHDDAAQRYTCLRSTVDAVAAKSAARKLEGNDQQPHSHAIRC